MRYVYIALLVIFVAAILVFSVQNRTTVTVSFLSWSTALPRFVVVIGAYLLGMASGGTVAGFLRHSVQEARKRRGSAEGGTRK
jgi:uncharacterized integral membrane protein